MGGSWAWTRRLMRSLVGDRGPFCLAFRVNSLILRAKTSLCCSQSHASPGTSRSGPVSSSSAMFMQRFILWILALLLAEPALWACSCGTLRPCANVARSAVIFTGTLLNGGDGWRSPSARFRVRLAFKGVQPGAVQDVDTASKTSCAAVFQVGQDYLVFANWVSGRLSTTACSGSRQLASAAEELRYLKAWQQGNTPSEVVGSVFPNARGSQQEWKRYYQAMEAAVVRVAGPAGWAVEARVDQKGSFAFAVPEAGSYSVSVVLPNWISDRESVTVGVPPRGCAETFFAMRPDGQVTGRAVEADGSPAKDVLLKLVTTADFGDTIETRTGGDGRFRFRGVLKGGYWLGVNPERLDDPSPRVPYAPTLYPGVREETHASVIRVSEFQTIRLETPFRLPPRGTPRTIRVVVTLDNGRPLVDASVSCTPEGRPYWRKDLTDSLGVVSFAAIDNVSYIVDIDIPADHPLAKAGYQRSQWIRVGPGRSPTDVRVVFRKQ